MITLLLLKLQYRVKWFWVKWGKHLTSFDLLEFSLIATRLIKHGGDKTELADWCKNYLIPRLDEVRDWAQEVINDNP